MMEDNAIRNATETWKVRMANKFSGEYSGGQAQWRICRTSGMDTAAEGVWDGGDDEIGCKDGDGLGEY